MRREYLAGDSIGDYGLVFLSAMKSIKTNGGKTRRIAMIMCQCGNTFDTSVESIISGNTKSCGCLRIKSLKTVYRKGDIVNKHGVVFISDSENYVSPVGHNKRVCNFVCDCGKKFKAIASNIINKNNGCGCRHIGWSKDKWIKNANGFAELYIIRAFDNNEEFIKIGITSVGIKNRFNKSSIPYEYEIIKIESGSPSFIWEKELELHSKFQEYSYTPVIFFEGYTECFDCKILKMNIL